MKKVIVTVIAGLCLSHIGGYAQSSALEEVFDVYAKYEEGFSYVYMGKGYSEIKISSEVSKEFNSIKFVKILTAPSNAKKEIIENFVGVMRATLEGEEFELIFKMAVSKDNTEIYLKRTGKKNLEKVIIINKGKEVSVTWIYGEEK